MDINEWVSIKDKLPEENGWYLVFAPTYYGGSSSMVRSISGMTFAKWIGGKTWSIEAGYHKRPGIVTHWMPMPHHPEERSENVERA